MLSEDGVPVGNRSKNLQSFQTRRSTPGKASDDDRSPCCQDCNLLPPPTFPSPSPPASLKGVAMIQATETKKPLKKHTTTKSSSEHFSHENFFIPHPIQCELSRNSIGFLSLMTSAINYKFFSRLNYNLIEKNILYEHI